ncbi:MAG TPA: protein kinase [Armatimonadota bacterium]|nr:protein kinase [Armatimonadota bacterium]
MPKRCRAGGGYLLAPGEWLPGKERYQVQNFLGRGAFAAAYRACNERGDVCFIKEYFPPTRPSEAAELHRVYATERDVVRRIGNYELIPRFWDAFTHEGYSYLVTDFVPGPDLETAMKATPKPELEVLIRWCVCLCHELAYLHSRNVIHHDLKPANVRLNPDNDPVVVDFSAAHWYRLPGETTDQLYGSDSYLAPEYAERSVEDAEAGKKMDVFAMGRILVELMVGRRMTQEDIDRRQDQLYGELLHSGKVDVSFLRAVFRSVAYDPERRYSSGVELEEEITPAAPPVGRARPTRIDFGLVESTSPCEVNIQSYNVGGGTLRAEIAAGDDWLEVGTSGAVTGKVAMFERNRQSVRVVAYPERIPPGTTAASRIVFTFPGSDLEVPVQLQRAVQASEIVVQPPALRLNAPPAGQGRSRLTFTNGGTAPASVQLRPPMELVLDIQPSEFVLAPHGKQDVTVAVDSTVLGDREFEVELQWTVESNPRPNIPVNAAVRRGGSILASLTDRFRKK